MNPHVNYAAVGAFLLAGTAIFVALILWLGDQGDTTPMESYVVRIETEVNGLSNGSTVRFLGVDVGSVTDIRLHREVIPFVEVVIQIREDLIIDETAYATLVVQGVTGIANIDLGSDPDWFNPIQFNQDGLAVIPFRRTGLAAVLAGGGDITSGTQQLLAQLNQMTGPENLVRVQRILTNLEEVTGVIADNRSEIPAMVEDLKSALAQLEALTVELRAATADVPVIAGNLRTTSERLLAISTRVDGWLAQNDAQINRTLGEGLDSLVLLVDEVRDVADDLGRLATRLREDPSRLIYRGQHDAVAAEP